MCVFSHSVMSVSLRPHGLQSTRLLCPGNFPGKNTGVGGHFLFQGVFPAQGSNPRLFHWQTDSLPLSHVRVPYWNMPLANLNVRLEHFYGFKSCFKTPFVFISRVTLEPDHSSVPWGLQQWMKLFCQGFESRHLEVTVSPRPSCSLFSARRPLPPGVSQASLLYLKAMKRREKEEKKSRTLL